MIFLKAFVIGGLICTIGQILIDRTKLTMGRILVLFVVAGAILGGIGVYQYLIDFAGAGASVPLLGFGNLLVQGTIDEINRNGAMGILTGGIKIAAPGIMAAVLFSFVAALIFDSKEK